MLHYSFLLLAAVSATNAYWLMGLENTLTTQRIDPIVYPGTASSHVHTIFGGSNFGFSSTDTSLLQKSECTSIPIVEDKSNYWVPTAYFQYADGSFESVDGGAVVYYLFDDKPGKTKAFPHDFRMLSGTPELRSYDANSKAQQAVTFLCLDFQGTTTKHNELPNKICPSGVRAQINFPNCWNGKDVDSPDHKSHVAYSTDGPDHNACADPAFPVTMPRIFMEMYWDTGRFNSKVSQAKDTKQPFVFSNGDAVGYGYHGDFVNGWDDGVLQRAVDGCTCDIYGSFDCCVAKGLFTKQKEGHNCRITNSLDEQTTGKLAKLPGDNPVSGKGNNASKPDNNAGGSPATISPVYAYTGATPTATGKVIPGSGGAKPTSSVVAPSSSVVVQPSSSVVAPSSSVVAQPSSSVVAQPTSSVVAQPSSSIVAQPSSSVADPKPTPTQSTATLVQPTNGPKPSTAILINPRPTASSASPHAPASSPAPAPVSSSTPGKAPHHGNYHGHYHGHGQKGHNNNNGNGSKGVSYVNKPAGEGVCKPKSKRAHAHHARRRFATEQL